MTDSLMDGPGGAAQIKQDITVKNKFNAFLVHKFKSERIVRNQIPFTFLTLPLAQINRLVIGQWAHYLTDKLSSGLNYMSSIRRQLEDDRNCKFFRENESWLTSLRTKMRKTKIAQAINNGVKLTNKAPAMTMDDKKFLSRTLFKAGDLISTKDRNLLDKQWVLVGRSSDVGDLLWAHMSWTGFF